VKDDHASSTALGVSIIRTVHQLIDELPHILEDPISPLLLSAEKIKAIESNPNRYQTAYAKGLRSHVVLRSRFAEDELRSSIESGVKQFISMGAGFDTFPFRQPDWAKGIQIIEIDHPASQKAKLDHFRSRKISFPNNLEFIPLDLEKSDISTSLSGSKIDWKQPIFMTCLGVLAYLSLDAVRNIFKSIGSMPTGSTLVLAFASRHSDGETIKETVTADRAAEHGEPWKTYFYEEELEREMIDHGFRQVTFLQPEDAADRYYKGRTDLPAPRRTRLCVGQV
jgi:methyltransferase (TIGR00027 family)